MIFSKKCDIIPLGKSHKSLEMQKNLVQNSGTRWYFSCIVYIFSADDIFRKVAENPEKSTILANILRYLQIYIPAGPHWGGRGRKFKSCHSDQNKWTALRCCSTFSFYSAPRLIWHIRRQRLCCLFLFLLKIFSSFYEVDEVSAIDPMCRL